MVRTFLFGAAWAFAVMSSAVHAADIRLGGDPSLDCVVTLSGLIEPGDADRFKAMMPEIVEHAYRDRPDDDDPAINGWRPVINYKGGLTEKRLCLDSPGGSLTEAMKIADMIVYGYQLRDIITEISDRRDYHQASLARRLGTAIPAGARCESACAILFMAGGYFSQLGTSRNGRDPDRVLHVDGKLGFHAPSLAVGDGTYSREDVGLAYNLAVKSTETLNARLSRYWFPSSLMVRMLATPTDDMFYVDTVEEAASWAIQLTGVPVVRDPSTGNLERLCQNMRALSSTGTRSEDQYSRSAIPGDIADDSIGFFSLSHYIGHRPTRHSNKETQDQVDTFNIYAEEQDLLAFQSETCHVVYAPSTGRVYFEQLRDLDHGLEPVDGSGFNWALLPGHLTLSDLSGLSRAFPSGILPGGALLPPLIDHVEGICAVYGQNGALVAADPCMAAYESRQRADRLDQEMTLAVTWPQDGQAMRAGIRLRQEVSLEQDFPFLTGQVFDGWVNLGSVDSVGWNYEANRIATERVPAQLPELEEGFSNSRCFRRQSSAEVRCFLHGRFSHSNGSVYRR